MESLGLPKADPPISQAELDDVAAYIATFVPESMNQAVTYNTAKSFTIPNIALNTWQPPVTTFTSIVTVTAPTKGSVSYSGLTATYTPTPGQYGADSFTYKATGPAGDSNTRTVNITISNPPAPVISSGGTASGATYVTATSYTITANNSPTSYGASNLPPGLSVNASTGVISGTPTTDGSYTSTVTATNVGGTGSKSVTFTISLSVPVVTSANTSGQTGVALSYQITAYSSPTSFNATGLPAGLSVNTSTGLISGTPTTVGSPIVTVYATNATGTGSKDVTFDITLGPPAITSATTASGSTGSAFSYTITATNSPTSFSSTALPAGLSLDAGTGVISGTPTTVGSPSVTVSATNATGTGSQAVTFNISLGAPAITSATAASGSTGSAFSYQITATNSPTSFSSTALPAGLSLNPTSGVISGTPTTVGSPSVTVYATNATGTGSQAVTFNISLGPPVITSPSTASGSTSLPFSYTITATNNPTSFAVSAGSLPPGLSLNTSTGLIDGTPTLDGSYNATVTATNATATSNGLAITFTISSTAPVISSGDASGPTDAAFSYTIIATNPLPPTTFGASGLPPGLSVTNTSTGVISGTPTTAGVYNVTLTATNTSAETGSKPVTFTITLGAPVINSANSVSGETGTTYANFYTITATNSPTSFSISAGTLPAGLSLNASTGVISGTPTTVGSPTVTVSATNATGTGSQAVTFNISLGPPAITSATTASGSTGSAFSYTITATNSPTSFSSTALPAGLSLDAGTGVISGTPTTVGSPSVTVSATNATGTGSQAVTFNISLGAPAITSATTASGSTGAAFSYTITATNSPTSFSSTALPAGLSLNPTSGVISGTPTTVGSPSVTVYATNATGTGSQAVTFNISLGAPAITSATTASGSTGSAFSYQITATNSPTSFGASGLPPGLSVNTSTGLVSGTPTVDGTYNPNVTATNINGTGNLAVTITINLSAPSITSANTASGTTGIAFSYQITASSNPTSFNAAPLPAGLAVNTTTGLISGTPTAAGTFSVTITATNSTSSDNLTLTITIDSRPDPTADANVTGLISAQREAANRFAKAQVSNFHQRLELLHRRGPAIISNENWVPVPDISQPRDISQPTQPGGFASYQNHPAHALGSSEEVIETSPSLLANILASALTTSSINLAALADEDPAEGAGNTGVWTAGNLRFGKRNQASGDVIDFRTDGASLGFDSRIDEDLALGMGVGYARDKSTIGIDGTRSAANARSIAVYGSYLPAPIAFIDGLISYGTLNFNTDRYVIAANDFAYARRKGNQVVASIAAGLEYRADGFLLSPYGRYDAVTTRLAEGTETGGGSSALQFASQTWNTRQVTAGARAELSYQVDWGWLMPYTRIEYQRNTEDGQQANMVYADQIYGTRYSLYPAAINANSLALGIGSNFEFANGFKLGLDYQAARSVGTASSAGTEKNQAISIKLSKELR